MQIYKEYTKKKNILERKVFRSLFFNNKTEFFNIKNASSLTFIGSNTIASPPKKEGDMLLVFGGRRLLTHAEVAEDVAEDFICADFSAGNVGKMRETETEVFGE